MTQEQGRRPDQSQQNTPLRPALEAFGAGNTPFSTGEQPKTDFETLQTTTEPNVPVSGRNRMNSQLGIGTDDRREIEHVAVRGPIPGGRTDIPSSGRTAEGGKEPKKFTRRRVLGWLTAGLGTAAVGGGIGGFSAANKNGETNPTSTLEATKPGGADGQPSPSPEASATASPNPSTSPSAEASPSASPDASKTPTTEGGKGLQSLNELKLQPEDLASIEKILGSAEIEVITSDMIVAIEPALKAKSDLPLTSIRLNSSLYGDEISNMVKIAKQNMLRLATATQSRGYFLTEEEVSSALNNDSIQFALRAYDPDTKTRRNVEINSRSSSLPIVVIHKATGEGMGIVYSDGISFEHVEKNGVLGVEIYSADPAGENAPPRSDGQSAQVTKTTTNIALGLAVLTDYKNIQAEPDGIRGYSSGEASLLIPTLGAIYNELSSPREAPLNRKTATAFLSVGKASS